MCNARNVIFTFIPSAFWPKEGERDHSSTGTELVLASKKKKNKIFVRKSKRKKFILFCAKFETRKQVIQKWLLELHFIDGEKIGKAEKKNM